MRRARDVTLMSALVRKGRSRPARAGTETRRMPEHQPFTGCGHRFQTGTLSYAQAVKPFRIIKMQQMGKSKKQNEARTKRDSSAAQSDGIWPSSIAFSGLVGRLASQYSRLAEKCSRRVIPSAARNQAVNGINAVRDSSSLRLLGMTTWPDFSRACYRRWVGLWVHGPQWYA